MKVQKPFFNPSQTDPRAINGAYINYGRIIFHSDLNNFYASVECALNPELRGLPVAVCGSVESRHGIVLAKNNIAKGFGVKTAEVIWQAKKKCPNLVTVQANYGRYEKYSRLAMKIYREYTDKVEPFGADEAWLDITGHRSVKDFESARALADEIRNRIFNELGLTVSIGVSYNKTFAKLASDYKKPDATTVFTPESYGEIISKLPVADMLFVGKSTEKRLSEYGIYTIGDLAGMNPYFAGSVLGKNGMGLLRSARGEECSQVVSDYGEDSIKSVGNSMTAPRDLECRDDVKAMCYLLSDKVASRLRSHRFKCNTIAISVRDCNLLVREHQASLEYPTDSTDTIAETAFRLFMKICSFDKGIRSIGVRATGLVSENTPYQISVFDDTELLQRHSNLDRTVDRIRERYGKTSLQRAVVMCDFQLTGAVVKGRSMRKQ